ncbi:MAG: BspA family leucine-rich repeat surface protein [Clostridia bacterium]|nr:BspA family leucine-rich repeat surface protein [Clostridia bacterium]
MAEMFGQCSNLTSLDLSSFDTSNVEYIYQMFAHCSALETIYVSTNFVTTSVTGEYDSWHMFYECGNLSGENGTSYNDSIVDKTYARIDGGQNSATPGYFTLGPAPTT